jgi:UPF0716 protein FxsA
MMRRRGLALVPVGFALLVVAEIAVFLTVAHLLGGGWALLLLAACTLAGSALLRREGVRGWRAFRAAAEAGRPPGAQVSDSLIGLLGALLLAVPGFLTALAGLLLLVPPGRALARRGVQRFTERRVGASVAGDLFGPRRVRVRRGDPVDADLVDAEPVVVRQGGHGSPAAIEGEIVDGEVLR